MSDNADMFRSITSSFTQHHRVRSGSSCELTAGCPGTTRSESRATVAHSTLLYDRALFSVAFDFVPSYRPSDPAWPLCSHRPGDLRPLAHKAPSSSPTPSASCSLRARLLFALEEWSSPREERYSAGLRGRVALAGTRTVRCVLGTFRPARSTMHNGVYPPDLATSSFPSTSGREHA
ncbi:hypothetical protein PENSPDRAFT_115292 [Peniophora sp. CONT]|nr:hypothetical protein PENSPDRAFT_115292 [Peniophora sp. CONT]